VPARPPPGHPHTPGNTGIACFARSAKPKVRPDVRYALIKGCKFTFYDGRAAASLETTRQTIMLVYDAYLSAADLAELRRVLFAEFGAHSERTRVKSLAKGRVLVMPPWRLGAGDDACSGSDVATLGIGVSMLGVGDDDDDPVD
jgi:hypothetical protein